MPALAITTSTRPWQKAMKSVAAACRGLAVAHVHGIAAVLSGQAGGQFPQGRLATAQQARVAPVSA